MVFTRSGRGGYPGFGRGGGNQATRDQMTPTRRRRSLSPTQFRFLYPATPLAVPGTRVTQQQNQQQTPQSVSVPETPVQSPATNNQSQTSTITIQPTSGTPIMMPAPHMTQAIDPTQLSTEQSNWTNPTFSNCKLTITACTTYSSNETNGCSQRMVPGLYHTLLFIYIPRLRSCNGR
jgi:hypothetical protein